MSDEIRVNGNAYSWGSIRFTANGIRYYQASEISYADKRTRAKFTGMGVSQAPTARSRGKYEAEDSKLKMLKETADLFREDLAAMNNVGGASYGDVTFPVTVEYAETRSDGTLKYSKVELIDCTWDGSSSSETEGSDPSVEEITIGVMRILRNGLPLYSDMPEEI